VIKPVLYDPDAFRRDATRAEDLGHAFPDYHIGRGHAQCGIAEFEKRSINRP
jgi:hypothetical protein